MTLLDFWPLVVAFIAGVVMGWIVVKLNERYDPKKIGLPAIIDAALAQMKGQK